MEETLMAAQETIGHEQTEFDRFYSFYNEMERQESGRRLLWFIGAVALTVIVTVSMWAYQHPFNWHALKPFELVPGIMAGFTWLL
jgi:hypothetical protein